MLEGVFVVGHIIIIVVGIGEEAVARRKYVGRADVGLGQEGRLRIADGEEFLAVVAQTLSQFVAQVGVGVAVADNLHRFLHAYRTVVGGDDDLVVAFGKNLEQVGKDAVLEPRQRDAAVGTLVVGQLTHHL